MAYDENNRMNAEQKEERTEQAAEQRDTEFAADSWMSAVFQTDDPKRRENITYDPYTHTERYRGEEAMDGVSANPPLANRAGNDVDRTVATDGIYDRNPVRVQTRNFETEAATEFTPVTPRQTGRMEDRRSPETDEEQRTGAGTGVGMTGLALSILSLFVLPYLIAPIGMILGYLAFRRDARTLGAWAMAVGAAAILGAVLIYPMFLVT